MDGGFELKIKDGFLLREIAGTWIVMPIGAGAVNFDIMLELNETSAFLWNLLEKGAEKEDLVSALLHEYEIDEQTARCDLDEILDVFEKKGLLEI